MLLPDQTYEQATLGQERLRSSSAYNDGGFPRLFALKALDVKRLQQDLRGASLYVDGSVGAELAGVLANNEMKFGIRSTEENGEGSGSSGVGSSGDAGNSRDGKRQELDVRLSMTNGGSKHPVAEKLPLAKESSALYLDSESVWSGRAASAMAIGHSAAKSIRSIERSCEANVATRSRTKNSQRAPSTRLKNHTDRGIGLESGSSADTSLSYTSNSSDDDDFEDLEGTLKSTRQRMCQSRMDGAIVNGKELALDAPAPPDGPDPGERDDYDKTSDFFNNIPEFQGEALGPFSIAGKRTEPDWGTIRTNVDILRACELFLMRHRMRPDFFCKYKTAMNPPVSAPASFPLSRSRTPIDVRKPKSVSPPMQRPASRAHGAISFSRVSTTLPHDRNAADRPGPIYSVPNRAGKKRRPNAGKLTRYFVAFFKAHVLGPCIYVVFSHLSRTASYWYEFRRSHGAFFGCSN
ncbi:uncharacterized protein LOC125766131 [Anopheles funestus]|uniref:uncharacterized protein LOC125766131 n=1 Tax=Anopheles funestus TaxID=62324 RepID=UPI0020C66716|nr:uncharacterized protein LOC125766131 [Anopheles funestus]